MNRVGSWVRTSKSRPCPICGKPDWCLVSADGSAAICPRIAEGSVKRCGEAGWLHKLRDERPPSRKVASARVMLGGGPVRDMVGMAARCTAAAHREKLAEMADGLGLSVEGLQRLGIGWSAEHKAWTFPMCDADGRVTGIRLRLPNGRKLSVKGGHEGLFTPRGLDTGDRLLIAEGPTDTAALLDLGFQTVGRPSCTGGVRLLERFIRMHRPRQVAIVADADEAGRRGAVRLAEVLALHCSDVRVIAPPAGVKDARAWLNACGTASDVTAAITAASPVRVTVCGVLRRNAKL